MYQTQANNHRHHIGVELGQISALALMLLLIAAWRKSHFFQAFSLVTNFTLIFWGGFLFLMQIHGYEHTTNEELAVITAAPAQSMAMVDSLENVESTVWKDTIEITIPARSDKEYKLFLAKGATFEYSWQTDGEALFFDFHGEPAGDTTGYFESFSKSTESQASGSLTSSFKGTHGWYWKNSSRSPVTITLKVSGDYQLTDKNKVINEPEPKPKSRHESIDSL